MAKAFKTKETAVAQVAKSSNVIIEQPRVNSIVLEVEGTADLIQNNFSQKTIEEMLRKHMGLSTQRGKKCPKDCIESATVYNMDNVVCLSPTAFKKGMLSASTQIKGLKKTFLRTQMFVVGQSIPINYSKMVPRMDMVRTLGIGRAPDVRFRPSFKNWSACLEISFTHELDGQTVMDLVQRAGSIGVGEWRPEKDGVFGTYMIKRPITSQKEIEQIRECCEVPMQSLVIPEWAMNENIDPKLLRKIASSNNSNNEEEEEE